MADVPQAVECPPEYTEFILRTQVYHCTPEEFAKIPWPTIRRDLLIMNVERKARRDAT